MRIRSAASGDVSSIVAIERECPTAAHWTEQQYQVSLVAAEAVRRLVLVAEATGDAPGQSTLLGFLVARQLAPDWELENIVVAPSAQRIGVGKRLLEALFGEARKTRSQCLFLEVRESNEAARGLYQSLGFRQTGRRKSYYSSPLEDAVLYSRRLD
jgi:[ribosomal protein S18]-alanine N-acetyltransferase